jgi:drug/metabolite transporter (DMT)-like permease
VAYSSVRADEATAAPGRAERRERADALNETPSGTPRRRTVAAVVLILAATIVFTISDVTSKAITDAIPAFENVFFRYLAYVGLAFVLLARNPSIQVFRPRNPRLQVVRGIFAFGSAAFFIAGLYFLPVGDATAINFVSPLMVVGLSAVWLGEPVGLKRWIAAAVGFGGVLLIMQPGGAAFQWEAAFPLLGALCWACSLVITRRMSATDAPELTMIYTAVIGLVISSVVLPFDWVTPPSSHWFMIALVAVTATAGHALIVVAFGYAPASLLATLTYIQIVWATALGYVVFGDAPGMASVIGMALIILSGLYTARSDNPDAPRSKRA